MSLCTAKLLAMMKDLSCASSHALLKHSKPEAFFCKLHQIQSKNKIPAILKPFRLINYTKIHRLECACKSFPFGKHHLLLLLKVAFLMFPMGNITHRSGQPGVKPGGLEPVKMKEQ